MENVKVTIGVGDPQGQMFDDLEVTVNARRTFTEVPRELLQRLGVPVERSVKLLIMTIVRGGEQGEAARTARLSQ